MIALPVLGTPLGAAHDIRSPQILNTFIPDSVGGRYQLQRRIYRFNLLLPDDRVVFFESCEEEMRNWDPKNALHFHTFGPTHLVERVHKRAKQID